MHMTSSKTKHELCTFLKSNGVITVSQVGASPSPSLSSLSVCVCVFVYYLFIYALSYLICVSLRPSSYHPTSSTLWSAWRGGLGGGLGSHLIFQAGAFSFHFFVKHVTQILAELPQRRPCKHLALLPLPLPLPLYAAAA